MGFLSHIWNSNCIQELKTLKKCIRLLEDKVFILIGVFWHQTQVPYRNYCSLHQPFLTIQQLLKYVFKFQTRERKRLDFDPNKRILVRIWNTCFSMTQFNFFNFFYIWIPFSRRWQIIREKRRPNYTQTATYFLQFKHVKIYPFTSLRYDKI